MVAALSEPELRQLEPVLYRFALRATRDTQTARDLVQEALVAAVAQAAEFAGRSTLRTWVIGILSHKVLDHFRRQASHPLEGNDDPALLTTPSREDVERVVAAREQLASVERALKTLPELERLALLLCHLRVLLHRGRHRLRRLLEHDQ